MDGLSIQRSPLASSPSLMKRQNDAERARLWDVAVAAFPPYAEYQARTTRKIPIFVAGRTFMICPDAARLGGTPTALAQGPSREGEAKRREHGTMSSARS